VRSSILILALVAATATTTELIKEISFPKLEGNSVSAVSWPVGPHTAVYAQGSITLIGPN
jgi:hypothetical protein